MAANGNRRLASLRGGVLLSLLIAGFLTGCGAGEQGESGGTSGAAPSGSDETSIESSSGESVMVGGTEALVWDAGDYGVILSHGAAYDAASWRLQAEEIAAGNGMVALAVEDTSPEELERAARYLREERGVEDVAFIGASAGASTVLELARERPELPDQLILISGSGETSGLGDYPKLFVASEDEGLADTVREMSEEAPGDENETLILPGSAHAQAIFETGQGGRLTDAMLERLKRFGG